MRITFHNFYLSDVDDVDVYAAGPIHQWQQTEQGRWVSANAKNLMYYTNPDPYTLGYRVRISGVIEDGPALTEYLLKYHATV